MLNEQLEKELEKRVGDRIGLALSGGGYRASLFHLGVIRRLEELGIMQDISVLSCISGGSIMGAFYTTEMEKLLRSHQKDIDEIWSKCSDNSHINQTKLSIAKIRLKIFEEIAEKFFVAMDKNMRMRATLYAPFFHIKGIKALFSKNYTRAELIQLEYDKWLFDDAIVDSLPSYRILNEEQIKELFNSSTGHNFCSRYQFFKKGKKIFAQLGTKVIINATSLINGHNKSFFRIPVWGFTEMVKANENVEKLSKIVGASSAVPGAFPPAVIGGDTLVDGGVSDNQGLHLFIGEQQRSGHYSTITELYEECDILLVSDASGQMLKIDQTSRSAIPVLKRTQSMQGFELRNKNIDLLVKWRRKKNRQFAFVQLYRSLKDREEYVGQNRVPSEYISALGGIRTDLDQFSHIEREVLMYHGYTLIDNQLRQWCNKFLQKRDIDNTQNSKSLNDTIDKDEIKSIQKLRKPPLFGENLDKKTTNYGKKIKEHLEVGKSMFLTKRLCKTHRKSLILFDSITTLGIGTLVFFCFSYIHEKISPRLVEYFSSIVSSVVPKWEYIIQWLVNKDIINYPITPTGMHWLATLIIIIIGIYLVIGVVYSYIGQPLSIVLDKMLYKKYTGKDFRKKERTHWDVSETGNNNKNVDSEKI